MTPDSWVAYAAATLEREQRDSVVAAYNRGEMPVQPPCPCCTLYVNGGCAAVVRSQQTGPCVTIDCACYGSIADGGVCEDCYVSSK